MEVVVVSPIKNPLSFKGNPLEPAEFRKRRLAIPTLVDETSVSWFFRLKAMVDLGGKKSSKRRLGVFWSKGFPWIFLVDFFCFGVVYKLYMIYAMYT